MSRMVTQKLAKAALQHVDAVVQASRAGSLHYPLCFSCRRDTALGMVVSVFDTIVVIVVSISGTTMIVSGCNAIVLMVVSCSDTAVVVVSFGDTVVVMVSYSNTVVVMVFCSHNAVVLVVSCRDTAVVRHYSYGDVL